MRLLAAAPIHFSPTATMARAGTGWPAASQASSPPSEAPNPVSARNAAADPAPRPTATGVTPCAASTFA